MHIHTSYKWHFFFWYEQSNISLEWENFTKIKTSKSDCKPFDMKEVSSPTQG